VSPIHRLNAPITDFWSTRTVLATENFPRSGIIFFPNSTKRYATKAFRPFTDSRRPLKLSTYPSLTTTTTTYWLSGKFQTATTHCIDAMREKRSRSTSRHSKTGTKVRISGPVKKQKRTWLSPSFTAAPRTSA
jgi:hypothetical protein